MMDHLYLLDADGEPVPCEDLFAWAEWFERSIEERTIAFDTLPDGAQVSTVFLSLDHCYRASEHLPILWETAAWDGLGAVAICERYESRSEALAGHARIVEALRAGRSPGD